jgi:hypothetical protein
MASLGGKHHQARTRCELTYCCDYEVVDKANLIYVAVICEGLDHLGNHEATLRYDTADIPAMAVVRMAILKYPDQTWFREGKPPDPRWIGWYGPYL